MKKIIIVLLTCLCLCENIRYRINAVGDFKAVVTNNVEGDIGTIITPQTVEITFNDPLAKFVPASFTDVSNVTGWFIDTNGNMPSDCTYAVEVVDVTADKLTVLFSGSIDAGASEQELPIELTIPYVSDNPYVEYDGNPYLTDVFDIENSNANYIINDPDFVIEYRGPYEISGTVGEELIPQTIEIEITQSNGDCFGISLPNSTLPVVNGLTPTVIDVTDDLIATIEYTGTPINPSQDLIHTTIKKEYMDLELVDRVVPDRADVRFNIVPKYIPAPPSNDKDDVVYTPPVTGID